MKVTVDYDQPVPAPVREGQPLGKVVVSVPDATSVEAPLYAAQSVPRMGPLGRAAMVAAHMIWGDRH
jgi:serine-type D-Ala-D-Ala carboxypeptidase (penicillin-binding protein 5/6)